jgi:RNA polymerase sigma factor (sigma-70 family)
MPTDKTDMELVSLVRDQNDSGAFKVICEKYEDVFFKICQKYAPPLTASGVDVQDIFDEKNYIIYSCIKSYDPSYRAKLSTWIGNHARYLCLNAITARKFTMSSLSNTDVNKLIEDSEATRSYDLRQSKGKEDFKYALNILDQLKDPRVKEVFRYRYFSDKSMIWTKISEQMGISSQTIINLHRRGIRLLRRKMESQTISDLV